MVDSLEDELDALSVSAFIARNCIVNENQTPIEFIDHSFLIDPYADETPVQVIMKAAQIGFSTLAIIKSIHLCRYRQANIIYTLPSTSVVKDFVSPKVDPLISSNPIIKHMIGQTDSTALKAIGKRFLYFRGSWEESAAISISAHILISDEVDRSNQKVLRTYESRLDAAKAERPDLGWQWKFSNPSIPGSGVDELWELSDKKHWMIKCSHCNAWQYMNFPDNIDFVKEVYICEKCKRELDRYTLRQGSWIKFNRQSSISGYWFSQMMVPWIPASKIIKDSKGDQDVFYNFTLGLPYITKDQSVSRKSIIECIAPDYNPRTEVSIGVDNGIVKTYVIGNKYGIFQIGETESWDEIEDLRNRYDAVMVIDANPYPNVPKKLVERYKGKVYIHYYVQDKKQVGTIRWGEGDRRGVVESDRTKIIDALVADLNSLDITFNLTITDLEQYIYHWGQMYRVIEETTQGIRVAQWKHIEGKPDHYAHATVLWKVGLTKASLSGGIVLPSFVPKKDNEQPMINPDNTMEGLNLHEVLRRTNVRVGRDWRYK